MPTNLPTEWYLIEEEYRNAKTTEEKIKKLEELIAVTPKHKGTENLLAQLRKKLAKLKRENQGKKKSRSKEPEFRKVGDILVSIVGLTNSGKSTLLKSLTNASVEISDKPYTTKKVATGVAKWKGVYIQFAEIPSFFLPRDLAIVRESDLVIYLVRDDEELKEIDEVMKENRIEKKKIVLKNLQLRQMEFEKIEAEKDFSSLLDGILSIVKIYRIYPKPVRGKKEEDPVVFTKKPTVEDVVKRINKKWIKTFKFARVFRGDAIKRVGFEYELEDGDVLEIHA